MTITPWVRIAPGALLALVGCGALGHGDYVDARAEAECRRARACALGFYESEYRDFDDCVDERADDIDDADDALPDRCDFDGEEARRCVSRIRGMSCEEFAESGLLWQGGTSACDLVWDCG